MREYKNFSDKFLPAFASIKTFKNFTEINASYLSGLNGARKGFMALSEGTNASYESIQYLMTDAKWDPEDLNQRRVDLFQNTPGLAMKKNGLISIDDVEQLHFGHAGRYVDYQYSSTLGKAVKSTKFVNLHYHDEKKDYHLTLEPYEINKNVTLSLSITKSKTVEEFTKKLTSEDPIQTAISNYMKENDKTELYLDNLGKILEPLEVPKRMKKSVISKFKKLAPSFESKIDIAINQIKKLHGLYNLSGKIFMADSWYSTASVITTIAGIEAFYLMRTKDNRVLETEDGDVVSVSGLVTSQAESFVSLDHKTKCFYKKVKLKNIGDAVLVVLREDAGDRSFITNILPLKDEIAYLKLIVDHIKSHWTIEEGHKKLNALGFDKYCGEASGISLKKHAALALFRYSFLVYLSVKPKWRNFITNVKAVGKSALNSIHKIIGIDFLARLTNLKVEKVRKSYEFPILNI